MKITYFHTLYGVNVTARNVSNVVFTRRGIQFSSGGRGCFIEFEYVLSIDEEELDL